MKDNTTIQTILIASNVLLGSLLNCFTYIFIGIGILIFSILMIVLFRNTGLAKIIIYHEIKSHDIWWLSDKDNLNQVLLSIALLSMAVKISAAIGLIIEGAAGIVIALAILIACGYFFDGTQSGMTIGLAYKLGRILAKIGSFLQSLWEKVIEAIVKLEFLLLGVKTNQ